MKDLFEELCKGCNAKALYDEEYCDACTLKDDIAEHDAKIRADAIDEYSNELFTVIERCTVNGKLDLNIDDLHNLEIIIKGLAEQMKEQKE